MPSAPQSLITEHGRRAAHARQHLEQARTRGGPRRARQHALVLREAAPPVEAVPVAHDVERVEERLRMHDRSRVRAACRW